MSHEWDSESVGSSDEDEVNVRVYPDWHKYRDLIERRRLYRLDTCRDVREYYEKYCTDLRKNVSGYLRACNGDDDNALCKDAGLASDYVCFSLVWSFWLIVSLSRIIYFVVLEFPMG